MTVFKKSSLYALIAILFVGAMVLSACAQATPTAAPQETTAPQVTEPPEVGGKVGVVLPTKEEPRWLQDEARFKEAFEAAGYEVQILFSDGDSAKERTNVQTLISQGVSVIVICPHDGTAAAAARSEERRVGKEGRSRWSPYH